MRCFSKHNNNPTQPNTMFPCIYDPMKMECEAFFEELTKPHSSRGMVFWSCLSANAHAYPFLKVWEKMLPNVRSNIEKMPKFGLFGWNRDTYEGWEKVLPTYLYPHSAPLLRETFAGDFKEFCCLALSSDFHVTINDHGYNIKHHNTTSYHRYFGVFEHSWFINAVLINPHPAIFPFIQHLVRKRMEVCGGWEVFKQFVTDLFYRLAQNPNPQVLELFYEYENILVDVGGNEPSILKILSRHAQLLPLFEKHPHAIDWGLLSANPSAVHLLERNMNKVCWKHLSQNHNATHLLKANLDKVSMVDLATNIHLVEVVCGMDLEKMKEQIADFKEELLSVALHPLRLMRLANLHGISMEEYSTLIA